MKIVRLGSLVTTVLLVVACVTVNIYFPAAQAEEAAGKIVDDILNKKQDSQPLEPRSSEPQSSEPRGNSQSSHGLAFSFRIIDRAFEILVPSAQAAQPSFSVNTPEIRALQAKMKKRNQTLSAYYKKGAIGFTREALVGQHDMGVVPLKGRSKVKKLLAAENRDRNQLYKAIATANGHPEWEKDVRAVFAKTWVERAEAGWWYQNSSGKWVRK